MEYEKLKFLGNQISKIDKNSKCLLTNRGEVQRKKRN